MTYANAVLPHALFMAARCWPEEDFLDVAETSFAFLDRETTGKGDRGQSPRTASGGSGDRTNLPERAGAAAEDFFWPVGNSDWYPRGEEKSPYDQQPVEAVTMADAARAAFSLLGNEKYLAALRRAHSWFYGRNSLHQPLVDVHCGSCYDGLQRSGVNRNQGAESTLSYLWTEVNNKDNLTCAENQEPRISTRSCSIATATTPS
jgi:hypothetical protein